MKLRRLGRIRLNSRMSDLRKWIDAATMILEMQSIEELAESRIVVIKHDLIVFHTTNEAAAAKIDRDGFRTGRELDVNERRNAVYFAGRDVNPGLYARNEREDDPYYGQRAVVIPANLKGLRLLDMTESSHDGLPYADPRAFPLHKAFNRFITQGDLHGISLFAEGRIDGTISHLRDGRIYEVCLPKDVANRVRMPAVLL